MHLQIGAALFCLFIALLASPEGSGQSKTPIDSECKQHTLELKREPVDIIKKFLQLDQSATCRTTFLSCSSLARLQDPEARPWKPRSQSSDRQAI